MRRAIVFLGVVLLTTGLVQTGNVSAQTSSQRSLNCAAYRLAGAIACIASESWIAPGTFPRLSQRTWPPEGYTLISRGLLSQTTQDETCVVHVRSLQRLRTPAFSETDVPLPPLHEGFPECPAEDRLTPENADYEVIVQSIRELLPQPTFAVQPDNNTLIGIHTQLEMQARDLRIDTQTTVDLLSGPTAVRIRAHGEYFVQWRESGEMTGPYLPVDGLLTLPAFQYDLSGDEQVKLIDVWTVHVTAEDMPTFYDIVYLGYPPLAVRVNELVISVVRVE